MNRLSSIFLLSFLFFSNKTFSQNNEQDSVHKKPIITDSLQVINIDSFLKKPFDLYKFKQEIGQSHSSSRRSFPLLYKPAYKGFYYCFFMFTSKMIYRLNYKSESKREQDGNLEIKTYKPLGKYESEYLDPTEVLVALQTTYNYIELPELAFISLDSSTIIKKTRKTCFFERKLFGLYFKKLCFNS